MTTMHLGIVTATALPHPDPDEPALVAALEAEGARVSVVAWDDDAVDWSTLDLAMVRSTWNYVPRRDAFVAWAERVEQATRLFNPARVLRDNTDKRYLAALAARGVPTVPTTFLEVGDSATEALARARDAGLRDVVLKPRVSAGSFATERFDLATSEAAAIRFLAEQLTERPMMLQPHQAAVDGSGERSLVVIDGELTHHVRKSPRFSGEPVVVSDALPLEPDLTALAERALAPFGGDLLYARVDVIRDDAGAPRVMEIELCEPYLMLGKSAYAVERLARAAVRRARAPR